MFCVTDKLLCNTSAGAMLVVSTVVCVLAEISHPVKVTRVRPTFFFSFCCTSFAVSAPFFREREKTCNITQIEFCMAEIMNGDFT